MSEQQAKQSIISQHQISSSRPFMAEKQTNKQESKFDGLSDVQIFAYGIGHFLNDLMAACWFNYLFYYLKRVVKTSAAPSALLAGQIADGIATPLVGYLSDRTKTKFGQRTPWYLGGLIIVLCCYIPIYQTYTSENQTNQYIYYTTFMVFINIGWAAVQISHMSLVPSISCSRKRRDKLNNLRNTFTFISNFVVLGLGVIIFKFMTNPKLQYALISYIITFIGTICSISFLYWVREVPLTQICQLKRQKLTEFLANYKFNKQIQTHGESRIIENQVQKTEQKIQSIFDWFKLPKFYLFGICYMGVRLYTNMFGTFLPFYLIGVLKLGIAEQEAEEQVPFTVALVPLIVYLFSVISSSRLNWFYRNFGRKIALASGTVICVCCMAGMVFLTEESGWVMYIIAVFVGISQPMVLSTGINFISDVVGTNSKSGAFVFGIYSLLDKVSAGLVIYFVASSSAYTKQKLKDLTPEEIQFIRYTMVLIPALSSVLATLIVISYPIKEYSKNEKEKKERLEDSWDDIKDKNKAEIQQQLVV